MSLLWFIAALFVITLVLIDLFVARPRLSQMSRHDPVTRRAQLASPTVSALAHGTAYLIIAMLLSFAIYGAYEHNFLGIGNREGQTASLEGGEATLQYLSCLLLEICLSLDSIFVLAAVFAHFKVREDLRPRLLLWGMFVALAFRAVFILAIGELTLNFGWFRFILAAILLVAAVRMLVIRKENLDPEKNIFFKIVRKITPIKASQESADPVEITQGRARITSLIVPILMIETADVFMALDSIPASFSFTREPWLIFIASAMAMLFVRSLSPIFITIIPRLRYVKIGLVMILVYCAVVVAMPESKIIQSFHTDGSILPTWVKLAFIAGALMLGTLIASLFGSSTGTSPAADQEISPLGEETDRLARAALTKIRRVTIFVVGVAGLLFGAVMAIGPGPGIPILLIALALLATEFVWARVLVNKYRKRAEDAAELAAVQARKRFSPWAMLGLTVITLLIALALHLYGHHLVNALWNTLFDKPLLKGRIPIGLVIGGLVPIVIGQAFIAYLAYLRKPQ